MNASEIQVVIQNGQYQLANNRDLAMLDVTLGVFRCRWPSRPRGKVALRQDVVVLGEADARGRRNPAKTSAPSATLKRW